jgi:hypothetical protein
MRAFGGRWLREGTPDKELASKVNDKADQQGGS